MRFEGVTQCGLTLLDARRLLGQAGEQVLDVSLRERGHTTRATAGQG